MCDTGKEDIKNKVEEKFKIRLVSCIDAVNRLECLYHVMHERYYKKMIELEMLYASAIIKTIKSAVNVLGI